MVVVVVAVVEVVRQLPVSQLPSHVLNHRHPQTSEEELDEAFAVFEPEADDPAVRVSALSSLMI